MAQASPRVDGTAGRGKAARGEPAPVRWSGRNAYSNFVAMAKFTLPLIALFLAGLIVFWQKIMPNPGLLSADISLLDPLLAAKPEMYDPRYEGVDQYKRPYLLTAAVARQGDAEATLVDLERPRASITLENGAEVMVSADQGHYRRAEELLTLDGDVEVVHAGGFVLLTPSARVDLKAGTAQGEAGVAATGPGGTLLAEGFQVSEDGNRVLFTGQSQLVVERGAKDPAGIDG